MRYLSFIFVVLVSCQQTHYENYYYSFTNYKLDNYNKHKTSGGVSVYSNESFEATKIDGVVDGMEECLGIPIRRDWFVVLIPDDWFESPCSESNEQLLPYSAPIEFCTEDKELDIPKECKGIPYEYRLPTKTCPCVCNWRVATQEDYIIVVTPNLKLFHAELARVVTGINNPWKNEWTRNCL